MNDKQTVISISTTTIIKVLLILFIAASLYYLRDIVLIILTAIVLASAVEPGTQWFIRRGLPRIGAVIIIFVIMLTLIAGFFYLILPYVLTELLNFMHMLPQYTSHLDVKGNYSGWADTFQGISDSESVSQAIQNVLIGITSASGNLFVALAALFGGALGFVLTFILAFYLAVQEKGVEEFLKLITPLARERYIVSLWHRTQHKIGRWMQGQVILALIVGVLVFIGLTILGVKNALFLAFISTVLEIIPVFGPFIGSIPGILVSFLQGGLTFGIVVGIMYIIVQQIESHVIYPLVMQKVLDIPPIVVIIALVVGAKAGGFLGVLISVPVAVALTEIMNDIGRNRILAREKFSKQES